ncbi:hypothetical protein [Halomarina litorea]|uniref:hypothetical protein n=1 Tax=Halomarina litorea TaxID=2961595 RepID=UPI0020C28C0D|nr:hypothetical protein [Halomarina sp. BCD28]
MDRPAVLTVLLLVAGLSLAAFPLVSPAEAPPDRVEFAVEPIDNEEPNWETWHYANFSAAERSAFDAALANASATGAGYYNATLAEAPPGLTPPANGIEYGDVRYDESYYLLQVKHYTYDVPDVALLSRLASLLVGVLLVLGAGYRRFV